MENLDRLALKIGVGKLLRLLQLINGGLGEQLFLRNSVFSQGYNSKIGKLKSVAKISKLCLKLFFSFCFSIFKNFYKPIWGLLLQSLSDEYGL